MEYSLLLVALTIAVTRSLLLKKVKKKEPFFREVRLNVLFFSIGMVSILPLVISAFGNITAQPFHLSAIYGLLLMLGLVFTLEAMERGSLSLTIFFGQCGFLIPTIFNAVYFKESVSVLTVIGIVVIVFSLVLSVNFKEIKFSYSWLIFAVSALVSSGLIGIDQKFLAVYYPEAKQTLFAFFSLGFGTIFGLVTLLITYLKDGKKDHELPAAAPAEGEVVQKTGIDKLRVIFIIIIGTIYGVLNVLNIYLTGAMPSVVFFPVYNVGVIVAGTVASAIVFKEKLNVKQIISIALGSLAIILIAVGRIV